MSDRAAYWRQLLGEWVQSGLSQAEFCRRRGIKAVNLAWWKRRLRRADDTGGGRWRRRPTSTRRTGFVEVALSGRPSSAASSHAATVFASRAAYELALPGGVELRLPDDFDPERVAALVLALATDSGAGRAAC